MKEDKLSRESRVQVRETRGLVEDGRQEEDVEMSDEPAGGVEETKPKKKKTPEEIEAGK